MITKEQLAERLELFCISALRNVIINDAFQSTTTIKENGELTWQVKATLNPLEVKLKISDQKEVSQEAQPEQESSTLNNDQTLPEKEQKLKTKNPSKVQYIVNHPLGCVLQAEDILNNLEQGNSVTVPETFSVQTIERNDL